MSAYQAGQRAALEKLAVFTEHYLHTAAPLRAPAVRGRGTDLQSTLQDAIKNLRNKYLHRAPVATQRMIDMLERAQVSSRGAEVKKITLGPSKSLGSLPQGAYNPDAQHVILNTEKAPEATLLHELGHASRIGRRGDPSNRSELEQLAEERRASAHALYTLGHGHPDLPDLAHAYGTYFEHAVPPKDVLPPRPENPRLDRLQHSLWRRLNYPQNHMAFEGVPPQLEMANFANKAVQARERAVARDVTPLEAEVKRLSANLPFASESDRARLNARIAHYQGRIKKLVDFHVSQGRDEALARLDFRQKLQDRVSQNTQAEMSRLKRFREPEPTFKDYAALTGEGRRNLEWWLSYTAEPALRRAFNYDVSKPAVDQIYQALREARR